MPKTRNIIIFISIALVFVLIYIFFIRSPSDEGAVSISPSGTPTSSTSLQVGTVSGTDSPLANDFLALLLSIKSIRLDDAIFSDNAFGSLRDSSITLTPDGNEGRKNPFAPFGVDNVAPPAPVSPAPAIP